MIYKTPFYYAIEKGNIELVRLLLTNEKIDINILNILYLILIYFIHGYDFLVVFFFCCF